MRLAWCWSAWIGVSNKRNATSCPFLRYPWNSCMYRIHFTDRVWMSCLTFWCQISTKQGFITQGLLKKIDPTVYWPRFKNRTYEITDLRKGRTVQNFKLMRKIRAWTKLRNIDSRWGISTPGWGISLTTMAGGPAGSGWGCCLSKRVVGGPPSVIIHF